MSVRRIRQAATVIALLGLAACSKSVDHMVEMRAMTFEPPSLTVKSGDRIVWRNADIVAHTATAVGRFDSGPVQPQGTFTVTVVQRGEVAYGCTLHPTMKGKLTVE